MVKKSGLLFAIVTTTLLESAAVLFAQTATGTAVVTDRNHGAQLADLRLTGPFQRAEAGDVTLQSFE